MTGFPATGLATACAYALAAVFVVAAASKLASPERTAAAFAALGLPGSRGLALAVPVVELAVAVTLVVAPAAGGVAALAVLAAFSVVVARALVVGTAAPCACFGRARSEPVSAVDLARNALLVILALAALATDRPTRPSAGDLVVVAVAFVAGTVVLSLARRVADARRPAGGRSLHR